MRSVNSLLLAIVLALLATGCHHNVQVTKNAPQTPPLPAEPVASMSVSPETVQSGQSAELTWNTKDATTVTIDGIGTVAASGSQKVTPHDSTTYHLLAKGNGGTAQANARITVNMPVTNTTPPLTDEQLFAQNMKDIFFGYDSAEISADTRSTLSADLQFLAQHPEVKVVIEGHCDERGSTEYNMTLGESRAGGVRTALLNGGISADRIKMVSYGKERPFCTTAENESCWQKNRRAHFVFRSQERSSAR